MNGKTYLVKPSKKIESLTMTTIPKNHNKTKKGQEKLNEILKVAMQFFIEHDSMGFSTTELADHLNMTQANLYHYVQSKRELWFALVLGYQYEIRDKLLEIANQNISNFDKILLMLKFYLNDIKSNPDRAYLQYRINPPASKNKGPFELQGVKEFNNSNLEIIREVLREGIRSGEFLPDLNPDQKVFFYWSLVHGATNFFMIEILYQSLIKNRTMDYKTLKNIEEHERSVIQIVEEDLSKFLISNHK